MTRPSAILLAAMATLAAGPASATAYYATFTGNLTGAADFAGLFGPPGTDISGMPFSARYRVDPGVPGISVLTSGYGSFQELASGSAGHFPQAISATLTINGHTQVVSGGYNGTVVQEDDYTPGFPRIGNGDEILYVAEGFPTAGTFTSLSFSIEDVVSDITFTSNFAAPFENQFYGTTLQDSRFEFSNGSNQAYGSLRATHLSVTASVPEPASWMMLIAGFGLAGAALRRQSRIDRRAALL